MTMFGRAKLQEAEETRELLQGVEHRVVLADSWERCRDGSVFCTFARFALAAMDLENPNVVDMGRVEKDGTFAVFLVLEWPGLMALRDAYGFNSNCFQPHVVIGYSEGLCESWLEARRWEWPFLQDAGMIA